ncbi:hypothetical protein ABZ707_14800 [Streptomyces sp. NPDC006923]|uniref:hypothetical protein n=1 Tax=Streptomyces sp. NPDC006923 TaxID=3155355 RepID=UPI0033C83FF7
MTEQQGPGEISRQEGTAAAGASEPSGARRTPGGTAAGEAAARSGTGGGTRPSEPGPATGAAATAPTAASTASAAPAPSTAHTTSTPDRAAATPARSGAAQGADRSAEAATPATTGATPATPSGNAAAASGGVPPEADALAQPGRPNRPLLAGAAMAGAVLVAVPLLLMGSGPDQPKSAAGVGPAADTVLGDDVPNAPGAYVPQSPSPSKSSPPPSKSADTVRKAAVNVPPPVSPSPKPSKSEPKPKAKAPKKKPAKAESIASRYTKDAAFETGAKLCQGQAWTSHNDRTALRVQYDGNLVLYRDGKATWAAPGALGRGGHCLYLQPDGNFVLYNAKHEPLWATGNWLKAVYVTVQDDGNLVLYNKDGRPVWATNTVG